MIRFTDLLEAETLISEKKALWWTEISTKRFLISLILFRFSIFAVDKERKRGFWRQAGIVYCFNLFSTYYTP